MNNIRFFRKEEDRGFFFGRASVKDLGDEFFFSLGFIYDIGYVRFLLKYSGNDFL